jgi:hypothetical protein
MAHWLISDHRVNYESQVIERHDDAVMRDGTCIRPVSCISR